MNRLGLELLVSLERQFADSKALHLKGKARVRLSQLSFLDPIRPIELEIVKALKRHFRAEGCLQYDSNFSIPAIIDDDSLKSASEGLHVSLERFKAASILSPAKFELPHDIQLACLHGQHRVIAAMEHLPPGDRWWLVDIYGPGLDDSAKQLLREGRSYSTNYSDGEIFRQIRVCQFGGDKIGEDRWRARITPSKERDLDKLLKRGLLINALNSILPFRGLWNAFHLGSMDIFLLIRCDEEIARYIHLIKETWTRILGNNISLYHSVDQRTVEFVQLRAPGVSKMDSEFIRQKMQSQELFPQSKDPAIRAGTERRLLEIEQPIPSIYTLFKDLRYLDPAARAVKALLPKSARGTLRQSLRFIFLPETTGQSLEIQDSESSYTAVSGNFDDLFDLAVRQLFLCALRYFANPSNVSSKKDMNPVEQTTNAAKRHLGFRLIELGQRIGFSIQMIKGLLEDPSERLLADMLHGLPKEIFNLKGAIPETLSVPFKEYLSNSTIVADTALRPSVTTVGIGEPLSQRCGRRCGGPLDDDDRLHLFLRKMHTPLSEFPRDGYDISSFYVKRSIYLAFFGTTNIPGTVKPSTHDGTRAGSVEIPTGNVGGVTEPLSPEFHEGLHRDTGLDGRATQGSEPLPRESPGLQVDFISGKGDIFCTVPFTREEVSKAAEAYAGYGFSLMDERGRHYIWHQCYDALVETETRRLVLVEPVLDEIMKQNRQGWLKQQKAHRMLTRNHASDIDLVHKGRDQQPTVEDCEEEEEL